MDIVTSLGADEEKIILAGSAKGNRFHLQDVSRNTPGSASVGYSSSITYQQVILSQVFRHRKIDAPMGILCTYLIRQMSIYLLFLLIFSVAICNAKVSLDR